MDVDREVDEALGELRVPVVPERALDGLDRLRRARRTDGCRLRDGHRARRNGFGRRVHGGGEALGHLGVAGPVGVQVGGVRATVGCATSGRLGLDDRAVELVAGDPGAGGGEQVVGRGDRGAVGEGEPRRHAGLGVERADHRRAVDGAAEVEQAGALGDRRHAGVARRRGARHAAAALADSPAACTSGKPPPR